MIGKKPYRMHYEKKKRSFTALKGLTMHFCQLNDWEVKRRRNSSPKESLVVKYIEYIYKEQLVCRKMHIGAFYFFQ